MADSPSLELHHRDLGLDASSCNPWSLTPGLVSKNATAAQTCWQNNHSSLPSEAVLFVLSAHVRHRFQAHSLVVALYSIAEFHPRSRVVIVDKASAVPITLSALPRPTGGGKEPRRAGHHAERSHHTQLAAWFEQSVHVVRLERDAPNTREYAGYAAGIAFLLKASGGWHPCRFTSFAFMQASMVLTEPLPSVVGGGAPLNCHVRALQTFGPAYGGILDTGMWVHRTAEYIHAVGLLGAHETQLLLGKNASFALAKAVRARVLVCTHGSSAVS